MIRAEFHSDLDRPWTQMEPVRLGQVPSGLGTADRFVAVELDGEPLLRVDLYRSSDESFAFEQVCMWSRFVAIGWGHAVFLVDPRTRAVSTVDLGSYFGHLYPTGGLLLVASAERLFGVAPDGRLPWRSDCLGIDGVVVHRIEDGIVFGEGEWDPPGGWRGFQVDLGTGRHLQSP